MRVMVLGAGIYQLPLIEEIKKKGFKAIVVSPDGPYPGLDSADEKIFIDTRNKEEILKVAKELEIDAILTSGTDVAVPAIGYVVDQLSLKGTGYEASLKSMDKILMKKAFIDNSVLTAKFLIASTLSEVNYACHNIGFPCMVKAIDSSGSRGISKVSNSSEIMDAYEFSLAVSNSNEVIVEEYLDGLEFGAQAFIKDGKITDIFFHNDIVSPPPISVPIGHSIPVDLEDTLLDSAKTEIQKAVQCLQIDNTVANVDLMLVKGAVYILEVGARIGATCIPENITIYTGSNVYNYLIDISAGRDTGFNANANANTPNAALLLLSDTSGIVESINIPKHILEDEDLIELKLDIKVGDEVSKFKVGSDRVGHLIVKGATAVSAEQKCLRFKNEISIVVCQSNEQ